MSSTTYVEMVHYECWVCGIPFAISRAKATAIRRKDQTFYCPNGCKLGLGKSVESELREKLDRQEQATQRANGRLQAERRSHAATKGVLTKTKKRTGNGVCPCCNRTFKQLARHMKAKHPDYAEESA